MIPWVAVSSIRSPYGRLTAVLFAEPNPTPYDLHFRLLGISVRISPWFWLANALFGWAFAVGISRYPGSSMSAGAALLIWTAAVLLSIVIHEMGHALAYRFYGVHCHIVLYQFGGLAVPDRSFGSYRFERGDDPIKQIVISLAGPLTQMLSALVLIAFLWSLGVAVRNPLPFIRALDFLENGRQLEFTSMALFALVYAFNYCGIWWALLNLVPIYPLDGGKVSREVFTLAIPREGIRYSLLLSIGTAITIALWAFTHHEKYVPIMFLWLAYSNFAMLQAYLGRGGGFGGGQW